MKCIVKDCSNHEHEGRFIGDLCFPCYEFIATGKGVYSQAYRNVQRKPLTLEQQDEIVRQASENDWHDYELIMAVEAAHGIKP